MTIRKFSTAITALAAIASCLGMQAYCADLPQPRTIDAAKLAQEIAQHRGKVFVVNFWATWCPGCVEEFPDLVKITKEDRSLGVSLLTISFDDSPGVKKAVIPFLAKNHLTEGIYVNKNGSKLDDAYVHLLQPNLSPDDPFGMPRTYIFNRRGEMVKVLVGPQTYATFKRILKNVARQ